MKIRLQILFVCFLCSCFSILILFKITKSEYFSGFYRSLPSGKLEAIKLWNLRSNSKYFAGLDKSKVYFGDKKDPFRLLVIDNILKDSVSHKVDDLTKTNFNLGAYFYVNSSGIYVFDKIEPIIVNGESKALSLSQSIKVPFFTAGIPISRKQYILRAVNKQNQNCLIKLISGHIDNYLTLGNKTDNFFVTDGSLLMNENQTHLFYVNYYKNQYLSLDTYLNIIYSGHTLDTVAHPDMKTAYIKSSREITLSKPPLVVNKQSAINSKWLFIHSGLKAENETAENFEKVSVIDIYAIQNGKYQFSIYLPDFDGKKLTDFRVGDNNLFALFGNYLYTFKLNF